MNHDETPTTTTTTTTSSDSMILDSLIQNAKWDRYQAYFYDFSCIFIILFILFVTIIYKIPISFGLLSICGILYAWLYPYYEKKRN